MQKLLIGERWKVLKQVEAHLEEGWRIVPGTLVPFVDRVQAARGSDGMPDGSVTERMLAVIVEKLEEEQR